MLLKNILALIKLKISRLCKYVTIVFGLLEK
jgi:hypothetical protein